MTKMVTLFVYEKNPFEMFTPMTSELISDEASYVKSGIPAHHNFDSIDVDLIY